MSAKILIALLAAVFTCAALEFAKSKDGRENEHAFKTAQFCMPQYDTPGEPRIYC